MSIRFGIDSVAIRDDLLFGWGWFLADAAPVAHMHIAVQHRCGAESRLVCVPGGARADVAVAHPARTHAASAGFIVQGRLRGEWEGSHSELKAELEDGSQVAVALGGFPFRFVDALQGNGSIRARFANALAMLLSADFKGVASKLRNTVARTVTGSQGRPVSDELPVSGLPAFTGRMELIFDHAMGGGANRFSDRLVADIVAREGRLCTITLDLPTLDFRVRVIDASGPTDSICRNLREMFAFLDRQTLTLIHVNELVSFDDPLMVVAWISMQARRNVPVRFYLHDFHAACPSWTLIDADGRYCGVPTLDACARCLPRLEIPFLAMQPETDMEHWRSTWGELLRLCEIVAFSESSAAILHRAYPDLGPERIAVRPHVVDYLPVAPIALSLGTPSEQRPLIIGVVGGINAHKGADIVWQMADLIEAQELPIRIVVIGTIENAIHSNIVKVLGSYQAERLPQLLQDERVDIGLLPSIWPETFSYVASELMQLQLPLVVFDLGAPAERVAHYARGRVVSEIGAQAALDAIQQLHRDLVDAATSCGEPDMSNAKPEHS